MLDILIMIYLAWNIVVTWDAVYYLIESNRNEKAKPAFAVRIKSELIVRIDNISKLPLILIFITLASVIVSIKGWIVASMELFETIEK